jgi:phage terminase Nu1 subunit (DNA packaging protein)
MTTARKRKRKPIPKYNPAIHPRQAFTACSKMGATDKDLAALFGISLSTFEKWTRTYDALKRSVKDGRDHYDSEQVEKWGLRRRALGYQWEEVTHELKPQREDGAIVGYEMVETKRVTKHIPPDTTACIFWLKNRRPDRWQDVKRFEAEMVGSKAQETVQEMTDVERRALFKVFGMDMVEAEDLLSRPVNDEDPVQ